MKKNVKNIFVLILIFTLFPNYLSSIGKSNENERKYWIKILTKIADPVLNALSNEQLRAKMPVEVNKEAKNQKKELVTHLEAFGRLMAGLAPWLELGPGNDEEGKLREKYIKLSVKCLKISVNPKSPDFMNFNKDSKQPLVDAAFLAHALLRAPRSLWGNLDVESRINMINALKSTRIIKPYENNWLLFSAMIEAALLKFDGSCEYSRIDYAVKKHMEWYKGDGVYGDGKDFHWDYYNSFVIQPMLLDILKICKENNIDIGNTFELCLIRAKRYATIQERLISPEGTFPPIGRSLAYRIGVFQLLGQISLTHELPENIKPAQVRCALTSVIKNMMESPETFDKDGWLLLGFGGHQPDIAENYISTGSLYLCSVGFLPLGLLPEDEFWTGPVMSWTSKKIWSGENIPADHAIKE
jgi:hypothetical protein